MSDLFEMADVLSKQPLPNGNRLAILTNAGGPGVLATEALASQGGVVAELSPKTVQDLSGVLPAAWSQGNPIDVLGDATAKHYADSLEIVAKAEGVKRVRDAFVMERYGKNWGWRLLAKAFGSKLGRKVKVFFAGNPAIQRSDEDAAGFESTFRIFRRPNVLRKE